MRNFHTPNQLPAVNPDVKCDSHPVLTETIQARGWRGFQGTREAGTFLSGACRGHEWAVGLWRFSKAWGTWERETSMGEGVGGEQERKRP